VPGGACIFPPMATDTSTTNASLKIAGATDPDAAEAAVAAATTPAAKRAAANAARGAVKLDLPAGSTQGSVELEMAGLEQDKAAELPAPSADADLDTDLVLKFGPCGQEFEKEVTVCMFVGEEISGKYYTMYTASQVSCGDSDLGYKSWEGTTNNVYDPETGKLCGNIKHFSIVAGATRASPTASFEPSR